MIDVLKLPVDALYDLLAQLECLGFVKVNRCKSARDYAGWDWSKRNVELAREHGVSPVTVSYRRRQLGLPKFQKYPYTEWDYSKPDAQIARENKVSMGVVRFYRLKLGKPLSTRRDYVHDPPVNPARSLYNHIDWKNIDWEKADTDLATEIGCTREYVRQKRAELGIQKAYKWKVKYRDFLKLAEGKTALRPEDVSSLGVSKATFAKYCALAGITRIRGGKLFDPRFRLVNWRLSNKLLTEIWKFENPNSVASHRCNFRKQKPEFRCRDTLKIPPEYQPEVDQELAKAEAYFESLNGKHA